MRVNYSDYPMSWSFHVFIVHKRGLRILMPTFLINCYAFWEWISIDWSDRFKLLLSQLVVSGQNLNFSRVSFHTTPSVDHNPWCIFLSFSRSSLPSFHLYTHYTFISKAVRPVVFSKISPRTLSSSVVPHCLFRLTVGQFRAEEWNSETNQYAQNSNIGIKITVDVLCSNKT